MIVKRSIRFLILYWLLLALTACAAPLNENDSDHPPEPPQHQEDAAQHYPPSAPLTQPEPAPHQTTQAWQNFVGRNPQEDDILAYVFTSPVGSDRIAENPELFDHMPLFVLGDPEAEDAMLLSFGLRYAGTTVRAYALSGENNGRVAPAELPREELFREQVDAEKFTVLASSFTNNDIHPPQFILPYAIIIETKDGEAAFHPTDMQTHSRGSRSALAWRIFIADIEPRGNPQPEEEDDTQSLQRVPNHFTDRDFDFISGFGAMSSRSGILEMSQVSAELSEFITQHNQTQGFGEGFHISLTSVDMDGNLYYIVANELAEDLYILRRDAYTGEFEVVREISDRHEHDNRYLQLPGSDLHFRQSLPRRAWHDGADRLVRFAPQPDEPEQDESEPEPGGIRFEAIVTQRERDALRYSHDERITWAMSPIVNPNNIEEHLMLGFLHGVDEHWWGSEPDRLIVMRRRGNSIVNWFITNEIKTENPYINIHNTTNIISGVNPGLGSASGRPYTASFNGSTVEVYFPGSFATYIFDFDSFAVSAHLDFDQSFRNERHARFLYASLDSRFELWEIHHLNMGGGAYVVFDTQTERVMDFTDSRMVDFISNTEAAISKGTVVYVYDLLTMESRRIELDFVPMDRIEAYIWDRYNNRHVVLQSEWHSNFFLSFFDEEGNHLETFETQQRAFYQQHSWFIADVRLIAEGQLYMSGQLLDLDTGEHIELDAAEYMRLVYRPLVFPRVERRLRGEPMGYEWGVPIDRMNWLSDHIDTLRPGEWPQGRRSENAAEIYAMILDAVDRLGGEDFFRFPGTDMICIRQSGVLLLPRIDDDNFSVSEFRFGEAGQLYGFWQHDEGNRFFVGINRFSNTPGTSATLVIWRITEGGNFTVDYDTSTIFPRGVRAPSWASRAGIFQAYNWQFTYMQVHSEGNVLVLTYHNAETDSRVPFARVIYRDGMFEVFAA